MLTDWVYLSGSQKRVKKGEEPPPESPGIPDTLSVVAWVGLSKASPRDVPVYQAINVALTELAGSTSNYPFQVGCFVCP